MKIDKQTIHDVMSEFGKRSGRSLTEKQRIERARIAGSAKKKKRTKK
jgi:hypothetical protein